MIGLEAEVENARRTVSGYHEFLRKESLSCGVYVLAAGAEDRQRPHGEDEVYYVVRGEGRLRRGSEELEATPGAVLFVAAGVPHRFHSIAKELVLLVFFAPPEDSAHKDPG